MQGALWGIEHFQYYLKGRPFLLFTYHKPLTGLCNVYKRTHNRLRQAMLDYNFQLIYKKGNKMPANYQPLNMVSNKACPTWRWRTYRTQTNNCNGSNNSSSARSYQRTQPSRTRANEQPMTASWRTVWSGKVSGGKTVQA